MQKDYFLFPIFLQGLQPPVIYTVPYIKNSFLPPIYVHFPPLLQNHLLMVFLSVLSDTQLKYPTALPPRSQFDEELLIHRFVFDY